MPIKSKKVAVSKKETTSKKPRKTTEKQPSRGDKKIHKHPKANINGFDKNPQNINRNGRPKKGISAIAEQIQDMGYNEVNAQDIKATYASMLNLSRSELATYLNNDTPILVYLIAENLLSGKGFEIAETMINRAQGTNPTTAVQINVQNISARETFHNLLTKNAQNDG